MKSVCIGHRPGSSVLLTQRKVSQRVGTAEILCPPCLLWCRDTRAAGTRSAADQFNIFWLPLAVDEDSKIPPWRCTEFIWSLFFSCLCVGHLHTLAYIISIPLACVVHIYWNACNFSSDMDVCLCKWIRILRIQMAFELILAAALHF